MTLFLRPTGFVDAPFGHDGQVLRLAGGMTFFSAVEATRVEHGRKVSQRLVPVDRLDTLGDEARPILDRLTARRTPLHLGGRTIALDQPQVMAILNMTPDSFSDGGAHLDDPVGHGMRMLEAGAALLDVGGESTRPGATTVWEGDEIARVTPAIARLAAAGAAISADTRKGAVMTAALDAGAHMINDVSALTYDPAARAIVAAHGCPVVLMHNPDPAWTDRNDMDPGITIFELFAWLSEQIGAAEKAGIDRCRIIVDPGIGFGKTLRHNLAALNGIALLHGLGCPIMLGASRKRMIGALANEAPVEKRLGGSVALALFAANRGVQIVRVHDAFETVQALKVWRGLRDEALAPV